MCGILGIWNLDGQLVDRCDLDEATDVMRNRGPDDRGIWVDAAIGLGHRRLAVIDLSAAGHQPMSYLDRYVIVYNGEVYNYKEIRRELSADAPIDWQSNSDTEVIMAAYHRWGPDCLDRFHGMFAFAIWDKVERRMFVARDRLGVKPLYYHHKNGQFVFASRPRAIMRMLPTLTRQLDESALRTYLEAGYIPAPASIYSSIRKLPAAHFVVVSDQALVIKRYWDYRRIPPERAWEFRREDDLLDELDEIITRSVGQRMVSDAPVGAFLSGGVDSSLVLAKMGGFSSKPPVSLTIGFAEKNFDESGPAEAVARYLGTQHYSEILKVDDLLKLVPNFLAEFDEPFFDYSYFPTMAVSRLAREHVTVSLSGDGGDELFGGYHYYQIARYLNDIYKLPKSLRLSLASLVSRLRGNRYQLLSRAMQQPDTIHGFAFSRSISKDFPLPLLPDVLERTAPLADLFAQSGADFASGLSASEVSMRLDMYFTLPDDYLVKLDGSSMAFSLESREPLLDQDLVEWAMRLPIKWKLRGFGGKYLLRKLLYRHVPRRLVDRPKMGFGVPMAEWLRGPLREFAAERFNSRELFEDLPISPGLVQELFSLHCSKKRNVASLLWALLALLEQLRLGRN